MAVGVFSLVGASAASAYVGPSFVQVPGITGGWQGQKYHNWLKLDSHKWETRPNELALLRRRGFRRSKMFFSGPFPPRKGASTIAITLDKQHPVLPQLMDLCASKTSVAELIYAESADQTRPVREIGPRPADIPEYFEYRLKDVVFRGCPVVEGAPEQAFVLAFNDIEWLNYNLEGNGRKFTLDPAELEPVQSTGQTKAFVVTWFAVAHDVTDDQCPTMNAKPAEEEYYTFMTKAEADKERAALADQGGANYENGQMEFRGPLKLNACMLPGILPDPGHVAPQTALARGLDLDGNDGTGKIGVNTCKHKNYLSADGRSGIDNQLFTVQGCVPGYQGHKGFLMQYANEQMRNGLISILVQISGIDDEQNDDSVDVLVLYSKDPMAKNASGTQMLADYTFRLTDNPEYSYYFTKLPGRIVNGVVVTEPVKRFQLNPGLSVIVTLYDAAMRLEFMPDGNLKGVLGGYQDWRDAMALSGSSNSEFHYGYQCPGLFNAFKRAADGLKDPVTGECNGISSAYDIEGVPAFVPSAQRQTLMK